MKILGISNTKDSGACLISDGKLIASVNEERFNRKKLTREFPENSIKWILKEFNLTNKKIDALAFGMWKGISTDFLPNYIDEIIENSSKPNTLKKIQEKYHGSATSDQNSFKNLKIGLRKMKLDKIPQYFCSHHMAHAYSAFCYSPFQNALVITLDGRGDFQSGSVSLWKRGKEPIILRNESELNSLGTFYGWITKFLGFTPDKHEGKITGLAAQGNPNRCIQIFRKILKTRNGKIQAEIGDFYAPYMKAKLPKLEKELRKFSREDIAAATQRIVEEIITKYVKFYIKKTKATNIALAGGIFANVLINMRIREIKDVKKLFVFPHMGDGGIPAGAAAYVSQQFNEQVLPIHDAYLGPKFSQLECEKQIRKSKLPYIKPKNFSKKVAELIDNGNVIGFFQGKMEYGPRALGNRSIIVRSTDKKINITLNKRLSRTEFMPFAPITLEEYASKCYKNWNKNSVSSYYMTSCFFCTKEMKNKSPAVVHIDNTARPQIISKKSNPILSNILKEYHKITNIPTLSNTSFNLHEEPIVLNPKDALKLLINEGIDILAIYPFIVFKKSS